MAHWREWGEGRAGRKEGGGGGGGDKRLQERLCLKDERRECRKPPQGEDFFRSESPAQKHFDKKGHISTVIYSEMEESSQRGFQRHIKDPS